MNPLTKAQDKAIAEIRRIMDNAQEDIVEIVQNLSADSYDMGVEDGREE